MIGSRNFFADGPTLAQALAKAVADDLRHAITERSSAVLAVSGGTTPQPFFEALSHEELNWGAVTVTLVDERQVDETSPRSNAGLVKQSLCINNAATALLVPLYQNPAAALIGSFDVVVLGMGNDGHTASFFPGGDTLAQALDLSTKSAVMAISAPGSGEPRLTFILAKLLSARNIYLHIQGQEKRNVLDKALAGRDPLEMPIRAVLFAPQPLKLYWCP